MKGQKIKYIGFYCPPDSPIKRSCSLAAVTKMTYIIQALKNAGADVEIVSPAWITEKPTVKQLSSKNDKKIVYPPSIYTSSRILRHILMWFSLLWLFFYLIFHIKKDDFVIVYHSMYLVRIITWLKKLKKFDLILEVEEIYSDVSHYSRLKTKREFDLFKLADKYLFSTELLNIKLNKENKPFAINYGTYQVEDICETPLNDGRIHVVYAGTFDLHKGAKTAVLAGQFLDERYHLHILGFGSKDETECILSLINEVSTKTSARITYDGCLRGDEYKKFIQRCHIGLSTQIPDAKFNDTSFPSKVLSYLSNGLRVVSVKIPVLTASRINDLLYYYEDSTPQSIADTIKSIDLSSSFSSRERLRELDEDFISTIQEWIRKS